MYPPTAAALLDVWERGRTLAPVQRGLLLLLAACPEDAPETLAALPIGQRDRYLLHLRELLFGANLASVADCPQCAERLELSFAVEDILVEPNQPASFDPATEHTITASGHEVCFRLPNSLDLLALADRTQNGPTQMVLAEIADPSLDLLQRCIRSVTCQGKKLVAADIPDGIPAAVLDAVGNAVVQEMAQLDAQADVQLDLTCPACDHHWLALFDILAFLWSEIDAWAQRTLQEVHMLASAYGWREAEILALSPERRQTYLHMIL